MRIILVFLITQEMDMPTEIEVWSLFWLATLANAAYFVGLAFLLWVSFRAANMAGESENLLGKIVVSIFCLSLIHI